MAKKNVVSQSKTMWVKKGDVVGGKVVKKGYVAQLGKPEKKVSATVKLTGGGTRTYKEGRAVKKPAKPMMTGGGYTGKGGKTGTAGKPSDTTTTQTGRKSYVGERGTRTKSYQTGEGMTARPKPPSTFQGQRFNIAGPQSRQLRVTKPVRVAYEVGSNIPRAGYQAGRTLADVLRKAGPAAKKTATNFWYE